MIVARDKNMTSSRSRSERDRVHGLGTIAIISPMIERGSLESYERLIRILESSSEKLLAFEISSNGLEVPAAANKVTVLDVKFNPDRKSLRIFLTYTYAQILMFRRIVSNPNQIDALVIYMGDLMLLPMLAARIARIPVIIVIGGSLELEMRLRNIALMKSAAPILIRIRDATLRGASMVVMYTPSLVRKWHMEHHSAKIVIAPRHFIDVGKFRIDTPIHEREEIVGFIGRLSSEKGIRQFVEAIPDILNVLPDTRFVVAGEGDLRDGIEDFIRKNGLDGRVVMTGWIANDEIPDYLNRMKLIVIPSSSEGLPNTLLEAMACGTPVLANRVGSVDDVITHGVNGFLMDDNSPSSIMRSVVLALGQTDLETITKNARNLVETEYTLEMASARFGKLIRQLRNGGSG